jgi:hypothetical protein
MGTYKKTRRGDEPGDFEVLYLEPSWYDDGITNQSVGIAPLSENEMSIICYQRNMDHPNADYIHFIFTEEEVEMWIEALQEVKKRWKENK